MDRSACLRCARLNSCAYDDSRGDPVVGAPNFNTKRPVQGFVVHVPLWDLDKIWHCVVHLVIKVLTSHRVRVLKSGALARSRYSNALQADFIRVCSLIVPHLEIQPEMSLAHQLEAVCQ